MRLLGCIWSSKEILPFGVVSIFGVRWGLCGKNMVPYKADCT